MAVTITGQPSSPNVTGTNLVYTVTSDNTTEPQFQYVTDIFLSGSVNQLTRIRQYPNPNLSGVFDIHRILSDNMGIDPIWGISNFSNAVQMAKTFTIKFGEEYGTSATSAVTLFSGINDDPGDPAVQANDISVVSGIVDPNNGTSYNLNLSAIFNTKPLTNYPINFSANFNRDLAIPIGKADFQTFSFLNNPANRVISLAFTTFLADDTASSTVTLSTASTAVVLHAPVGPQNLLIHGGSFPTIFNADWSYYRVVVNYTTGSRTLWFRLDDTNCNYDRVSFSFLNALGGWDYFNVNLPQEKTTSIVRRKISRPFVDYSSVLSEYSETRRGLDYYNLSYNDQFKVTSNWVNQDLAEWLSEMIESPVVFIRQGLQYMPICITNSTYLHNTNSRGQKNFQYEIEYQFANHRLDR